MTYYGVKARFALRLEVKGRNPEDAWRRARTAARLVTEHAAGVNVRQLEYSGKFVPPERRQAMREAGKATEAQDLDDRIEIRRLYRAITYLTRRRDYLDAQHDEELPDHILEHVDREHWALNVAIAVLDGSLRAHEPPPIDTGARRGDQTPVGGLCTADRAQSQTPRVTAGDGSVSDG